MGISKLRGILNSTFVSVSTLDKVVDTTFDGYDRAVIDISIYFWAYLRGAYVDEDVLLKKIMTLKEIFTEVICIFDGLPPTQKLKEQIQRRLSREEVREILNRTESYQCDFFDVSFTHFRKQFAEKLKQLGVGCITHDVPGEADHKIFTFIRHMPIKRTVIFSNDWDIFVRCICYEIQYPEYVGNLLYVGRSGSYSPAKIESSLDWVQMVMLLGCDYYPGIGNFKVFKLICSSLYLNVRWIKITADTVWIDYPALSYWLQINLQTFNRAVDYMTTYFTTDKKQQKQCKKLWKQISRSPRKRTMSDSSIKSTSSDSDEQPIHKRSRTFSYSEDTVAPTDLNIEKNKDEFASLLENTFFDSESCIGDCHLCRVSDNCELYIEEPTVPISEIVADLAHPLDVYESWLDILLWTVRHYFHKSSDIPVVYPYGYAPDIEGMIIYLTYRNQLLDISRIPHTINNKEYTTKKIWDKYITKKNYKRYNFCPKRPVFYRSQLPIDFFTQ